MVNFDNTLRKIGEFGRAQILFYLLIGLCGIPTGEQNLSSVFTAASQDHWCLVSGYDALTVDVRKNLTIPRLADGVGYEKCEQFDDGVDLATENATELNATVSGSGGRQRKPCIAWEFDRSAVYSTVGSQFNLVCQHSYVLKLITSIYMAGFLVGCTFSGVFSDKFGRIKTVVAAATGQLLFGLGAAFAPVLTLHIACRFMVAACTAGLFTTAFVIAMEIIGPKYRMHLGILMQAFFAIGFILLSSLAYFIRNHVTLQVVLAIQSVVFVFYLWFFPESPRWLVTQGRLHEAAEICKRIARLNGRELPVNFSVKEEPLEMDLPEQKVKVREINPPRSGGNLTDLLRTPTMRARSLNIFFIWLVVSLVYYGLSLNSEKLGGSVYLNSLISGAVEFPAYAACCLTLNRFGRVRMLVITLMLSGAGCITAAFIELLWLKVTLAMIGKSAVSAAFAIIYVYSAEVFPTVIRNAGVGMASTCARIGGLMAPQIVLLSSFWQPLPFVMIGSVSLIAALLALLLPETLRQPLPETIEDGENFGRSNLPQIQVEIDE